MKHAERKIIVTKQDDGEGWLHFEGHNKSASISLDIFVASRGPIAREALREWFVGDGVFLDGPLTKAELDGAKPNSEQPIPMVLHCPNCTFQHVDAPQPEKNWTNPPHRSHECQQCGCVWRPSDRPTTGVASVESAGKLDWPVAEWTSANLATEAMEAKKGPGQ